MLHTALLSLVPLVAPAQESTPLLERAIVQPEPGQDGRVEPAYADDYVIVRFGAGVDEERHAQILGQRFVVDRELVDKLQLFLVRIVDETSVRDAIVELEGRRGIQYATPDHVVTNRDTFPNDSQFNRQYGKHNTGQSGGTPDADFDAPAAWDRGTGSSDFAVAIVDSGTEHTHNDLIGNRWENTAEVNGTPGVDDDNNGYVDDRYGWNAFNNNGNISGSTHGTHVAGIAAAEGNNGIGIAGVSWSSKIVSISGSSGFTSTVLIAYGYALDLKDDYIASNGAEGANIVSANSSFGIDQADCNQAQYRPWNDMMDLMGQSGILSCGATANSNWNVDTLGDVPTGCSSDFLISVTATNRQDRRTFSAYGVTQIDLGAPGADVYATVTGNGYGTLSGTSMATPQVTGAIALLHSVASPQFATLRDSNPGQAALEIKRMLMENVDVVPTLDGFTVSGGRMNLEASADEIAAYGASGVNYCGPAVGNSSGLSAEMAFGGSVDVSMNDFDLIASGLPVGTATLFLGSREQGFVANPGGSQGNLCLGGQIGRFDTQVAFSDGTGTSMIDVDLSMVPQPTGFVPVLAGETWYFQAWYRDAVLGFPVSNFSDGLAVFFE